MICALTMLMFVAVEQPLEARWQRYQLRPDVAVAAPARPELLVEKGDGKSAPLGLTYWLLRQGAATYTVSILPVPEGDRERPHDQILRSFMNGVTKPGGGQLAWDRRLVIGKLQGIEWEYANEAGSRSRARAFISGHEIKCAAVVWRNGQAAPTGSNFFLESFQIR
jgi:hypothetical protein